MRELSWRDSVNVRNTWGGVEKWVPGTVIRRLGPLTYLVKVGRQLRYVPVDHLLRTERENSEEVLDEEGFDDVFPEKRAVVVAVVVSKVDIWYVNNSKCCYQCAGARNRVTL